MFPRSHMGLSTPLPNWVLPTTFLALRVAISLLPCPGAAVSLPPVRPGLPSHAWHGAGNAGSTRDPQGTLSPETLPGPTCNSEGGRQGRGLWRRTRPSGPRETRTRVLIAPWSRQEAGYQDSPAAREAPFACLQEGTGRKSWKFPSAGQMLLLKGWSDRKGVWGNCLRESLFPTL